MRVFSQFFVGVAYSIRNGSYEYRLETALMHFHALQFGLYIFVSILN